MIFTWWGERFSFYDFEDMTPRKPSMDHTYCHKRTDTGTDVIYLKLKKGGVWIQQNSQGSGLVSMSSITDCHREQIKVM